MTRIWRNRPLVLWLLMCSVGILGVRGLAGGGQFLLVPTGDLIGVSTAVLSKTPFRDFLFPGLFLFIALGILPLGVFYSLYREQQWAWYGALTAGVLLTGWAITEGVIIGFGERLQYFNLLQGVVTVVLSLSPSVHEFLRA